MTYTLKSKPNIISPTELHPAFVNFVRAFYDLADEDTPQDYAHQYLEDGVAVIEGSERVGRSSIIDWRENAWGTIKQRWHAPLEIACFGPMRLAVFGRNKVTFADGATAESDFVGLMEFVQTKGGLKLQRYQPRVLAT